MPVGKKSTKMPSAPDPSMLIALQSGENRTNTATPFGSSQWVMGPDGRPTQQTSLSPAMQGVVNKAFGNAMTDSQRLQFPTEFENLAAKMAGNVGKHYGLSQDQLKADPAKSYMPAPQTPGSIDASAPAQNFQPLPYTPPQQPQRKPK